MFLILTASLVRKFRIGDSSCREHSTVICNADDPEIVGGGCSGSNQCTEARSRVSWPRGCKSFSLMSTWCLLEEVAPKRILYHSDNESLLTAV